MSPEDAELFLEQDMKELVVRSFCGGLVALFSARSPGRDGPNQDAACLIPFDDESGAMLVADGVGGMRGGAQASSTALYEMCASLEQTAAKGASLREGILDGIESANREVAMLGIGAATTLAVVELRRGLLRTYHVGDSEILVVGQRGKLKHQTVSHSPMGYAVESGLLDEKEAMQHEDRHFVFNVVGIPDMRIEVGPEIELAPRDTVLVACDGLFDNLSRDEIIESLRKGSLEKATRRIVRTCLARMSRRTGALPSKPDDLTLIAYRLDPSTSNGPSGGHAADGREEPERGE